MKASELRGFKTDDLKKREQELKEEFFGVRLQFISGSLENTAKLRTLKRDLARLKTVMNEKVVSK